MTRKYPHTRFAAAAALALALTACGSGHEGEEFAPGNSEVSPQQVDAALGPADQSVLDGFPEQAGENAAAAGNGSSSTGSVENATENEQ